MGKKPPFLDEAGMSRSIRRQGFRIKCCCCGLVALAVTCFCQAEFQVNNRTSLDQKNTVVAVDNSGNFIVVWTSYYKPDRSNEILARRFDAGGEPLGDEFQINTITAGNQGEPAVAMNATGDFVVVWQGPQSPGEDVEDIFARRFDSNGTAVGDQFRVNTITADRQLSPSVAMNDDGNFVVVWESWDQPGPGQSQIRGQLFDNEGTKTGAEFVVNDEPAVCRYPDVAMDDGGKFVVVWVKDSASKSVWIRRFNSDGTAPYLGSKVNDEFDFTSLTEPIVAMDAAGNHVVVWDGHPDSYLFDDVFIRRYHYTGVPLHSQFRVNLYQAGAQCNPALAMNRAGEFVVLWQGDGGNGIADSDVFGQRFPAQGEHIGQPILTGGQFRFNSYVAQAQRRPDVAMMEAGRFVAAWESYGQDGSGYGVFGKLGPEPNSADINQDGFVDFTDFSILAEQWGKAGSSLAADLVDDDKIDEQDLSAFCRQWLSCLFDCSEADFNGDGEIDFSDYASWAAQWKLYGPDIASDIDGSGIVDLADLQAIILNWLRRCGGLTCGRR